MFLQKQQKQQYHAICCNLTTIFCSLLLFIGSIQTSAGQYNCGTANGSNGQCLPKHQCYKLLRILAKEGALAKQSLCRGPFVCCSPADRAQSNEIRIRQRRETPNEDSAIVWERIPRGQRIEQPNHDRWKLQVHKPPNGNGRGIVWDSKSNAQANAKLINEPGIVWGETQRTQPKKDSSNEPSIVWSDTQRAQPNKNSNKERPNYEPAIVWSDTQKTATYEPGIVWGVTHRKLTHKPPNYEAGIVWSDGSKLNNDTSFAWADSWNIQGNNDKPTYERKRQTKDNLNYEAGVIWGSKPTNSCTNPNRKSGTCQSIYDCPSLMSVLQGLQFTGSMTSQRRFLQQSQCQNGIGRTPFVCCTADQDYASTSIRTTTTARPVAPIPTRRVVATPSNGMGNVLPEPPRCGPQTLSDKIYNGNDTALDQYPWMVLLEYVERSGRRVLNCGGSLINQRYVLTAAHCVVGQIETEVGPLARVRLGEYDINSEIDCIKGDCNKRVLELDIEQVVAHPEFNPRNTNRYNDIALLRLSADVEFNDFIRPVCLPLANVRSPINVGESLIVAGWGRTLLAQKSNIKQQLAVPVNDFTTCQSKFKTKNINLMESQLCAGGEFGKDSCDGDSGGPLMRESNNQRWYLEGIVSFGNRCGLEGWPGVYTRVADYMDWIQQTVRP